MPIYKYWHDVDQSVDGQNYQSAVGLGIHAGVGVVISGKGVPAIIYSQLERVKEDTKETGDENQYAADFLQPNSSLGELQLGQNNLAVREPAADAKYDGENSVKQHYISHWSLFYQRGEGPQCCHQDRTGAQAVQSQEGGLEEPATEEGNIHAGQHIVPSHSFPVEKPHGNVNCIEAGDVQDLCELVNPINFVTVYPLRVAGQKGHKEGDGKQHSSHKEAKVDDENQIDSLLATQTLLVPDIPALQF